LVAMKKGFYSQNIDEGTLLILQNVKK